MKTCQKLNCSELLGMMWQISLEHPNVSYNQLIDCIEAKLEREITSQERNELYNLYSDPGFYADKFDETESTF